MVPKSFYKSYSGNVINYFLEDILSKQFRDKRYANVLKCGIITRSFCGLSSNTLTKQSATLSTVLIF